MPPFRDDQIIIIAPGSQTTLAQLGLPESFTPARCRIKSRMFRGEKAGEWEPYKVRKKLKKGVSSNKDGTNGAESDEGDNDDVTYEEDLNSDESAVWPVVAGEIVDWSCFFALMHHAYNALNPPFHTPILLVAQPKWTPREHERLTQFFFEKFKPPAFTIIDSAQATCYGFGLPTATIVDIGADKVDITAVADFLVQEIGRGIAIPECGGEAMTQRLHDLLAPKGLTRDHCEQLKRSPICEILPFGTPLPGSQNDSNATEKSATVASTGAEGTASTHRHNTGALGDVSHGPKHDTEAGYDQGDDDEAEGVVDVASIVAGGKMNEYLARKEKEKADKAAAKKKGAEANAAQAKMVRLRNADKEYNSFSYEKSSTTQALEESQTNGHDISATAEKVQGDALTNSDTQASSSRPSNGQLRQDVTVGAERFLATSGGLLESIAASIHRTILSVPDSSKRSELWDSLVIVGNGAKIRGFSDALVATLTAKYLISPSSATIFTSELPSNLSTPLPTGANTPQHHGSSSLHGGHGVNPLLLAATTASAQTSGQHLQPPVQSQYLSHHGSHSSHGQTPTSIKLAKIPEYFPEWKEVGSEEAAFLGAQVAAKVLFVVDQGAGKGYMTRTDYNEQGPSGIHDYSM